MRTIIVTILFVTVGVAVLTAARVVGTAQAAKNELTYDFDSVGTVCTSPGDPCGRNVNYWLLAISHNVYQLAAYLRADKAILAEASKDGGWVRVKGKMMMLSDPKGCRYVEVVDARRTTKPRLRKEH